jgi:uncharacterized RDD family membrane protein YckC
MAYHIDILTPQLVPVRIQLASIGARLGASLIDTIVFYIMYYLTGLAIVIAMPKFFRHFEEMLAIQLVTTFPIMVYLITKSLMETYSSWQTPGKRALGIRIERLDGKSLTLSDAFTRNLLWLFECLFTAGFPAMLVAAASPKSQRLGDWAAFTIVVNKNLTDGRFSLQHIRSLKDIFKEKAKYPQVITMTESDMMLAKRILEEYREKPSGVNHQSLIDLSQQFITELNLNGDAYKIDNEAFVQQLVDDYVTLTR